MAMLNLLMVLTIAIAGQLGFTDATDAAMTDLPIIGSFEEADAIGSTTYCESKSTCTHELEAKAGKRIVSYRRAASIYSSTCPCGPTATQTTLFSLGRHSHGHVSRPGGWISYTLNRSGAALGESFKTFFGVWTNLARAEQAQYCDVRIDTMLVCARHLADTLGADGTAGLHDCAAGGGAEIGIITGGSGGTVRRPVQPDSESARADPVAECGCGWCRCQRSIMSRTGSRPTRSTRAASMVNRGAWCTRAASRLTHARTCCLPRAGYTYACFDAVTFAAATAIEASLDVYVAQVALAHIHAWCTCPPVSTSILATAHLHWC
jgi:hypothetical protein